MMYEYVIDLKAQDEIEQSFEWYVTRSAVAADGFLAELEDVFRLVCLEPRLWPMYEYGLREVVMDRYPFTVVYLVDVKAKLVVIISVFHHSRHPKGKYGPES